MNCPDPTLLPQSQPSFVLLFVQTKYKENSCSACGHQVQDLTCLILDFRIWTSPTWHLWHYFFHFDLWFRLWGLPLGGTVGSTKSFLCASIPLKESGCTLPLYWYTTLSLFPILHSRHIIFELILPMDFVT